MLKYKHTYKVGEIKHCQICGSKKLEKFLDLGFQPLADDLKKIKVQNSAASYTIIS